MSKLAAFLGRAIPTHQQKQSSHLGDRTGYVGASDIAGCPRKAALGKQCPSSHDITTLLRFSRGHAAQAMYAEFFRTGGALFEEEVEVRHPDIPEIRCHIDDAFDAEPGDYLSFTTMFGDTNDLFWGCGLFGRGAAGSYDAPRLASPGPVGPRVRRDSSR